MNIIEVVGIILICTLALSYFIYSLNNIYCVIMDKLFNAFV